ncbi:MAG: major capsid protein [Alphaproteobacteria bacterium]|jgi:hypothetical protein|nr:major capsid protein [Alphaproteobacteria bacterium]
MAPREIPDIFSGQPFSAVTLTGIINNTPYTPNFLGSIGLYAADGVRTTSIAIGERNGALQVVATSPRGSEPEQIDHPVSALRTAPSVHIQIEATVSADEVQSVLAPAGDGAFAEFQTPEALITERVEGPFGLRARIELTHEYHRLGGIRGVVMDKDGTTELYNWYSFFGIAPMAAHNMNFGTLDPDASTFEQACATLKRDMLNELDGLPVTNAQPVALCGDNYYDQVWGNKEVKAWRKAQGTGRDTDVFSQNKAFSSFTYGGITFVNYRGTKDGKVGIATDEGRLFPFGVPGLFQMLFAPPPIMGLTNTKGLPVYALMPPHRQTIRQAVVEAQSNPLTLCVRPRSLRQLTKS